ncbi:MAG: DUF6179 domain-containing protein [Clostridiales bacterium]|nr:DUF6179 domain-containing protein [Clostridiales bacterium]
MNQLIPIVAELARKYEGCDSTSITYEKAQMLMEGILYCIDEYNHSLPHGIVCADISVTEQYRIGSRLVQEKAREVRDIYNEMADYFDDYGMECLHDTVGKGIPEFLKWYNVKFSPQETLLTLDYPLLVDIHDQKGVDAVHSFICSVRTEQRFLRKYDRNYVTAVLEKAIPGYRSMFENVCGIVLMNTLGHLLMAKPLEEYGFRQKEYDKISDMLSGLSVSGMESLLRNAVNQMIDRGYGGDEEMKAYLYGDLKNIAVRLDLAVKNHHLERIFVI